MTTVEPIRSKKDVEKVERYLQNQSKRDHLIFVFGTNCGLRISDIVALNVGDVRGKNYVQIVEKKTGKSKRFPLNDKLKLLIADFVKGKRDKEPLFKSLWGRRYNRITAYYMIRDACKNVGLEEKIVLIQCEKHSGIIIIKSLKMLHCCKKSLIIQANR